MKLDIALVDDHIPSTSNERISHSEIKGLLELEVVWPEVTLKNLVKEVIESQTEWRWVGFKHPELFITDILDTSYRPDIMVYDWDFLDDDVNPEEKLKEILSNTFCVVGIYSGSDKKEEIEAILQRPDFADYKGQCEFIDKGDANSHQVLVRKIASMYESNFAFKYGRELRHRVIDAADKVLVELGKVHLQTATALLGDGEELKEMVVEKIRNHMESIGFTTTIPSQIAPNPQILEIAKKLWSYRLYHVPSDQLVRRGDILVESKSGAPFYDELYVVINADCDLSHFWSKNFASINLVKICRTTTTYTDPIERLKLTWADSVVKIKSNVPSMTVKAFDGSEDLIVLPYLRLTDTEISSYIVFPKDIKTLNISAPQELLDLNDDARNNNRYKRKLVPLKYNHLQNYSRVARISEPFLTPLITHILTSINGYGVPDYPKDITIDIKNLFPGILP